MTMYIQTQNQYTQFQSDELTDLLGKISFTINKFDFGKVITILEQIILLMILKLSIIEKVGLLQPLAIKIHLPTPQLSHHRTL